MKIKIEGLNCPNCAKKLETQLGKLESIKSAEINFFKGFIEFSSENPEKAIKDIIKTTATIAPEAKIVTEKTNKTFSTATIIDFVVLMAGIGLGICCLFAPLPTWAYWTMFVSSALLMGHKTFYKAFKLLLKGIVDENLLVTISVVGATAVGEHFEGLMVIALYSIGKVLEGLAVNKSKKSIEDLTNFKPEFAVVLNGEEEITVSPSQINIGDILLVKPGERISVDGIVVEGSASLDIQSLTGESLPSFVCNDTEVLSGSIVLDGTLKIKATKKYEESTVNKVIEMIESASEKKSKTETFISKITKWYTLGVIACAVLVWGIVWAVTKNIDTAIYRGLIFLVVSCPCAFAISVPLSYFSGLGNASKNGILIKGSNFLDACAKLNLLAFDKTGTITTGEFEIVEISSQSKQYSDDEILHIASLGEQYSLHPLAKAITKANTKKLKNVKNLKEVAGEGVYFDHENKTFFVGKRNKSLSGTTVEVFENDTKIGQIVLSDKIKENSKTTCQLLKKQNIKTVMLSGDSKSVVESVATEVGIDEAHAELLPQDKFEWLSKNIASNKNKVGYVGDGLNDAPSLTLADVGFCMGLKGNSASIEASDIVIANDNLEKIPMAIEISKYTRKIVWQNIILSAMIKVTFLTLGALGVTGMLSAVIADVGVTVAAILNSLRALNHKTKFHHHKTCSGKN